MLSLSNVGCGQLSPVTMYIQEREALPIKRQPSKESETGRCLMVSGSIVSRVMCSAVAQCLE